MVLGPGRDGFDNTGCCFLSLLGIEIPVMVSLRRAFMKLAQSLLTENLGLSAMASLIALVTGHVLELADDGSMIQVGVPEIDQAELEFSCSGRESGTMFFSNMKWDETDFFHPDYNNGYSFLIYGGIKTVEVELANWPLTCKDKLEHLEPCIPHNDDSAKPNWLGMSPPPPPPPPPMPPSNKQLRDYIPLEDSYYRCSWTGPNQNTFYTYATRPWADWVEINGVRVERVGKLNCTMPELPRMMEEGGYDFTSGKLEVTVNLVMMVNGTNPKTLPYHGYPGGNVFTATGLTTPPSPPAMPPMPHNPEISGPGSLYNKYMHIIHDFKLKQGPSEYPERISRTDGAYPSRMTGPYTEQFVDDTNRWKHLCYYDDGDHDYNSYKWHYACDNRGNTMFLATWTYSNKKYVVGGFARGSWDGRKGWYYDQSGETQLFQIEPYVQNAKVMTGMKKTGNAYHAYATYRTFSHGPTFGYCGSSCHDWYVDSTMYKGYANPGSTYALCRVGNAGSSTCQNAFAGSYSSWTIKEAEMWSTDTAQWGMSEPYGQNYNVGNGGFMDTDKWGKKSPPSPPLPPSPPFPPLGSGSGSGSGSGR